MWWCGKATLEEEVAQIFFGQKFHKTGKKIGSEFRANNTRLYNQLSPDIAMNAKGDFAVVWVSQFQDDTAKSIYAKFFKSNDDINKVVEDIRVNRSNTGIQAKPSVAINSQDKILVTWENHVNDDASGEIYAQLVNWGGTQLYSDLAISIPSDLDQLQPHVSSTFSGDFIVIWSNKIYHSILENTVIDQIAGQAISKTGAKTGSSFSIPPPVFNSFNSTPFVTSNADGTVILWQSYQNGHWQIWMQRLNAHNRLDGEAISLGEHLGMITEEDTDKDWDMLPLVALDNEGNQYFACVHYDRDKRKKSVRYFFSEKEIVIEEAAIVDDQTATIPQN